MIHLMINGFVKENIQIFLVRKNAQSHLLIVPVHEDPCGFKTLHLCRK